MFHLSSLGRLARRDKTSVCQKGYKTARLREQAHRGVKREVRFIIGFFGLPLRVHLLVILAAAGSSALIVATSVVCVCVWYMCMCMCMCMCLCLCQCQCLCLRLCLACVRAVSVPACIVMTACVCVYLCVFVYQDQPSRTHSTLHAYVNSSE